MALPTWNQSFHNRKKELRRELTQGGADVFEIAALALARNEQLQERVRELEKLVCH